MKFLLTIAMLWTGMMNVAQAQCPNGNYKIDNNTNCDYSVRIEYVSCNSTPFNIVVTAFANQSNGYLLLQFDQATEIWVYDAGTFGIDGYVDDGSNLGTIDQVGD